MLSSGFTDRLRNIQFTRSIVGHPLMTSGDPCSPAPYCQLSLTFTDYSYVILRWPQETGFNSPTRTSPGLCPEISDHLRFPPTRSPHIVQNRLIHLATTSKTSGSTAHLSHLRFLRSSNIVSLIRRLRTPRHYRSPQTIHFLVPLLHSSMSAFSESTSLNRT